MKRVLALVLCLVMCFSLTACFEKPTIDSFITEIKAEVETSDDTGELKLFARDDSLVYSYKYKVDLGVDNTLVATALESAMEKNASTYTDLLSRLKDAVKSAESVIVEFLDKDGNVIYTKEYK